MDSSEVKYSCIFLLYTFLIQKKRSEWSVNEMTAEGVLRQKQTRKARGTLVQDLSKGLELKRLFIYVVVYF